MNIIIGGSRSFQDFDFLKEKLDNLFSKLKTPPIILSGGATGADKLGERYAYEKRLTYKIFHADWKAKGKFAGPIRNSEMVGEADCLITFWDGKSKGTKDCIDKARKKGIKVKVIYV